VAIIAVILAITLRDKLRHYIEENDDAVTNAVTFVPLVIGTQFLVRSLILWRRHRQRVKAIREEKGRLAANGGADAVDPVTGDVFSDKCVQRRLVVGEPSTLPNQSTDFFTLRRGSPRVAPSITSQVSINTEGAAPPALYSSYSYGGNGHTAPAQPELQPSSIYAEPSDNMLSFSRMLAPDLERQLQDPLLEREAPVDSDDESLPEASYLPVRKPTSNEKYTPCRRSHRSE